MDNAPTMSHVFYGTRKGRISPEMMTEVRENNLFILHLAICIQVCELEENLTKNICVLGPESG